MKKMMKCIGCTILIASIVIVLLACGDNPKSLAKQMHNIQNEAIKDGNATENFKEKANIIKQMELRMEVISDKVQKMSKEDQLIFIEEYKRLEKENKK